MQTEFDSLVSHKSNGESIYRVVRGSVEFQCTLGKFPENNSLELDEIEVKQDQVRLAVTISLPITFNRLGKRKSRRKNFTYISSEFFSSLPSSCSHTTSNIHI